VRPSKLSTPKLAAFTSGSAVIASEKRLSAVKRQHRKVAGIDMEVYGFHRAVELCSQSIHALSAKVVVNKANEAKGELHDLDALYQRRSRLMPCDCCWAKKVRKLEEP
jgi:adenosylhomocysteine nucleosidase